MSKITAIVQSIAARYSGSRYLSKSLLALTAWPEAQVRDASPETGENTSKSWEPRCSIIYLAAVFDSSSTDFLYQAGVL
jgi:hypothetical protein